MIVASQVIPSLLWKSKAHYHIDKSSSLDSILSQLNPEHAFITYVYNTHFNVVLWSHAYVSQEALSLHVFLTKFVYIFPKHAKMEQQGYAIHF
jgi:hypothetical protein